MRTCFPLIVIVLASATATPSAQTDLDAFMARVLEKRDDNWKKLEQYVLNERETLQVTGLDGAPIYGFRREFLWYPRDGRFIKSPLTADGVSVSESDRLRFENVWVERELRREKRAAEGKNTGTSGDIGIGPGGVTVDTEPAMREALEPGFVSSAYFLRFKFDPGNYALVGREKFGTRDVLRVEYYPTLMFKEGRTRPNRDIRERNRDVERQMNKVALVTLWVLPDEHQIVRYEFTNIDMDFLPAQWLLRLDKLSASMEMGQPFRGVWLPQSIRIGFDMTLATGEIDGRYTSEFYDYRLAKVDTRIR